MSCHEWERGEILLPSKSVKKVRDEIWTAHNKFRDRVLEAFELFWHSHSYKVKKATSFSEFSEILTRFEEKAYDDREGSLPFDDLDIDALHNEAEARRFLSQELSFTKSITKHEMERRLKIDLPKATARVKEIGTREFSIRFDNRTLHWSVPEGNHNVERARESSIVKAMFNALDKVDWTRGSGGIFWREDEYSREADHYDPTMISYSKVYGPVGKKLSKEGDVGKAMVQLDEFKL